MLSHGRVKTASQWSCRCDAAQLSGSLDRLGFPFRCRKETGCADHIVLDEGIVRRSKSCIRWHVIRRGKIIEGVVVRVHAVPLPKN